MTRNSKKKKAPGKAALKISETLIRFSVPLIESFGPDIPKETLRELFMIATTVWNAVVLEQLGQGNHYIDDVKKQLGAPEFFLMRGLIDVLVEQKRMRFAEDLRMISHQEVVFNDDDSWRLRVEARSGFDWAR